MINEITSRKSKAHLPDDSMSKSLIVSSTLLPGSVSISQTQSVANGYVVG